MTEILTERLRIRCMAEKDVPAIVAILNVWEVNRWLARPPFPYTEKDALDFLAVIRANHANPHATGFVLAELTSDVPFGAMGARTDEQGHGELGYWIGKPHWRQGYAREAARAVVAHLRTVPTLRRLRAKIDPDNLGSERVLRSAGFVPYGREALAEPTRAGSNEYVVFSHPAWPDHPSP